MTQHFLRCAYRPSLNSRRHSFLYEIWYRQSIQSNCHRIKLGDDSSDSSLSLVMKMVFSLDEIRVEIYHTLCNGYNPLFRILKFPALTEKSHDKSWKKSWEIKWDLTYIDMLISCEYHMRISCDMWIWDILTYKNHDISWKLHKNIIR